MSDRLTQLQVCLDQLVEQFNATVNYVNVNTEPELLDESPNSVTNLAASAPLPGQPQGQSTSNKPTTTGNTNSGQASARQEVTATFDTALNELSTDIILKSRQISMLIDSLPGIGVSGDDQFEVIKSLSGELQEVEREREKAISEKEELLQMCESLILDMASGISRTKTSAA